MTRDEAVARIQRGLGFRSDRATEIAATIKEAQREMERGKTLPRFLLVEGATLTLTTSSQEVALPTNFLRRSDNRINYIAPGETYPRYIEWRDYEMARRAYARYYAGFPAVAALRASTIWFGPGASTTYTLTWDYYKRADSLENGSATNEWLDDEFVPEYLIGEAGWRMAMDLRDSDAVSIFDAMRKTARSALFSDTIAQETDDGPVHMGSNL